MGREGGKGYGQSLGGDLTLTAAAAASIGETTALANCAGGCGYGAEGWVGAWGGGVVSNVWSWIDGGVCTRTESWKWWVA